MQVVANALNNSTAQINAMRTFARDAAALEQASIVAPDGSERVELNHVVELGYN